MDVQDWSQFLETTKFCSCSVFVVKTNYLTMYPDTILLQSNLLHHVHTAAKQLPKPGNPLPSPWLKPSRESTQSCNMKKESTLTDKMDKYLSIWHPWTSCYLPIALDQDLLTLWEEVCPMDTPILFPYTIKVPL